MTLPLLQITDSLNTAVAYEKCQSYLLLGSEASLGNGLRTTLYFVGIAYCFIGLSAITARFFRSMENVVKQTYKLAVTDPLTKVETVTYGKVWNYTIADITLLAFGSSFPQISLATIDAIRNLGNRYAGGLGPGTLVGSAAFDLFPIHAVCVIVPKAGELKKISDIGVWLVELFWSFWAYIWLYIILMVWTPNVITVWESLLTVMQFGLLLLHAYAQDKRWPYLSLPFSRSERPLDWVPEEEASPSLKHNILGEDSFDIPQFANHKKGNVVDIISIHADNKGALYQPLYPDETDESSSFLSLWKQQFVDALKFEQNKLEGIFVKLAKIIRYLLFLPWRIMFAFVPPYDIAHGWIAFICSLLFINGIAYIVTRLTDLISCVTGINAYVIAFTALAAGTSWPDLVASKIAVQRQTTADSAIANITCSNAVNIYVGIGIPWLIDTTYNYFAYHEPLRIENAEGISYSLVVFFSTAIGCIFVLVLRRIVFGAELGGPRIWAWITCVYFMMLWLIFIILSSLKLSGLL